MENNRILISGCSGGGKSTLLDELQDRGHRVVSEPGRRVVTQVLAEGGSALPWQDMRGFAEAALALAKADLAAAATTSDRVFFDRGIIDAAAALARETGADITRWLPDTPPYAETVFLTPPWPEIYRSDAERRHSFDDAVAEYDRLKAVFATLGYAVVDLPKTPVSKRADFLLDHLRPRFAPPARE